MSAKAFIFDCDGTLADTESVWFAACTEFVRRYGGTFTPSDQRQMMGRSGEESMRIMQRLIPQIPQGEVAVSGLVEERRKCFRETRDRLGVAPMPGALELIEYANRKGIAIGLATSSFREDAHAVLEALHLRYIFNAVVTADDVVRPKPDPEIYLKTAKWLGAAPEDCVVFEDSEAGLQSAIDAGMRAIFVWDKRFHDAAPSNAIAYIRSFEDYFA